MCLLEHLHPDPGPHQRMVKVESADVVSGNIDSRQGARDLGHNPTLI